MVKFSSTIFISLVVILALTMASCLPPPPEISDPLPPSDPDPEPLAPGTGLLGSYFDSTSGERVLVRNDSGLNFYWATGTSPHSSVPHDYFSIVWEGQIRSPETGNYVLSVRVDDGFRLFVNGQNVSESWKNQGGAQGEEPLYDSIPVSLSSTELRNIRLEYYEGNWTAAIRLYWRKEGETQSSMQLITPDYLYPASSPASQMPQGAVGNSEISPSTPPPVTNGTGLSASYFNSTTGVRVSTRIDQTVNFNWGNGAPVSGLPTDYYSAVWTGTIRAPVSGTYTFRVTVDDGTRLFLNNQNILSSTAWQNQAATTHTGTFSMSEGTQYPLRLEYYEATYSASIQLNWTRPDGITQVIPLEFLYPASSPASQMPEGVVAAPTGPTEPTQPAPTPPTSTEFGARDVPRSKTPVSSDKWVSPTGSGTACSQSNPCTLQTGVSQGGFIWLLDGTYNFNGQLSVGDGKTLEAYNPKKATIDFGSSSASRITLGNNNVLRNIIVRRSAQSGVMVFGNNNLIHGVIAENNFQSGFQTWPSSGYTNTKGPTGGSYNNFTDSIARFNIDSCPSPPCYDSDADGISISAGRGNRITHFTAYGNADDGIDLWASYETIVENSAAYDNGFTSTGIRIGNGMQYKMGCNVDYASYCPVPNNNRIRNNWAYGQHVGYFNQNGGEGFADLSGNVYGADKTSWNP